MARKADVIRDPQSRILLDQLNTKTVGAPPTETGLIGDQAPASIFSVNDYDKIKNQINIEADNIEAMNALVTIGMITQKSSLSGPISGTSEIKSSGSMTGTNVTATIKSPGIGEVWQLMEAEAKGTASDTPRFRLYLENENGDECELGDVTLSGSSGRFDGSKSYGPVVFDHNLTLKCQLINGSSTTGTVECALVRVR
jgi:hypothetical protein